MTIEERLDRLLSEVQQISFSMRKEPVKIRKTPLQLFQVLKKKNELGPIISQEESSHINFILSQNGVKVNTIQSTLQQESYNSALNKEKKKKTAKSEFKIQDPNASDEIIEKGLKQMMTTQTKVNFPVKSNYGHFVREEEMQSANIKKRFMERKGKMTFLKHQKNTFSYFFQVRFELKQDFLGGRNVMDQKKLNFFQPLQKYIQSKVQDPDCLSLGPKLRRLLSEFLRNNPHQEFKSIWDCLSRQVQALDFLGSRYPEEFKLFNSNSSISYKIYFYIFEQLILGLNKKQINYESLSQEQRFSLEQIITKLPFYLTKESIKQFEKEFQDQIRSLNGRCQMLKLDSFEFQKGPHSLEYSLPPFFMFIEQNYLNEDFANQIQHSILFDQYDMPIWALIYVLFKAGNYQVLEEVLRSYQGNVNLIEFKKYLDIYRAHEENEQEMNEELRLEILRLTQKDIFESTLYMLIMKHDDMFCDALLQKLPDYIWSYLKICKFGQTEGIQRIKNYRLLDLQKSIYEQGSSYFTPQNNSPLVYFKILTQVLCYDKALDFLSKYQHFNEEYVHFSLVLNEMNLIKNPYSQFSMEIDLPQILRNYVKPFLLSQPLQAIQYQLLLNEYEKIQNIAELFKAKEIIHFFYTQKDANQNLKDLKQMLGQNLYEKTAFLVVKNYSQEDRGISLIVLENLKNVQYQIDLIMSIFAEEYKRLRKDISGSVKQGQKEDMERAKMCLQKLGKKSTIEEKLPNNQEYVYMAQFLIQSLEFFKLLEENKYEDFLQLTLELDIFPLSTQKPVKDLANHVQLFRLFQAKGASQIYLEYFLITVKVIKQLFEQRKEQFTANQMKTLFKHILNFQYNELKKVVQRDSHLIEILTTLDEMVEEISRHII